MGILISCLEFANTNTNKHISLNAGDVLLLYTDGIIEARSETDEFYGEERLADLLLSCGKKSAYNIRDAIIASLSPYTCDDDISFVVIKKKQNQNQ